jgi:hypothetical protein
MKIEEIIRYLPELNQDVISYENLNGGLSNLTYKVKTKQRTCVLRYYLGLH